MTEGDSVMKLVEIGKTSELGEETEHTHNGPRARGGFSARGVSTGPPAGSGRHGVQRHKRRDYRAAGPGRKNSPIPGMSTI